MDIEVYNEFMANGETAFANENYDVSMSMFSRALEEAPNDVYALSRAGAAAVACGKFEEAFGFFRRATDNDPENGDNLFNMGNAYFFLGNIASAMEYYTLASQKKCSDDVKARICYQIAELCLLKEDYHAALVNFQKYEDLSPVEDTALDSDILADKVNIYLHLDDYDNAEKCSLKWVYMSPQDIRSYMVYFNVLMAKGNYTKAAEVLDDAEKYAVKDEKDLFAVKVSRANHYITSAGGDTDTGDCLQKGYDLLNELITGSYGTKEEKNELVLVLAEVCISMDKTDEALELLKMLSDDSDGETPEGNTVANADKVTDPVEIEAMMRKDLARVERDIRSGRIDENNRTYSLSDADMSDDVLIESDGEDRSDNSRFLSKVYYMMLSCYAYKKDYAEMLACSQKLKNCEDSVYYSMYGKYTEAFAMKKLAESGFEISVEEADKKYAEILAYFRDEMIRRGESAPYALLFRSRMLAEMGNFAKARELAQIMPESDRGIVLQYIAECEMSNG